MAGPTADSLPHDGLDPLAMAELFAACGRQLATHGRTADAVQALADLAVRVVPGARWASVSQGHSDRFVTMASSDQVATDADRLQYRLGTGPCIDAVNTESVFESPDLAADDRWSGFGPQAADEFGTRSVLSMRLTMVADDDLNAGLNMYGDEVGAFDDRSRLLATVLAATASTAVESVMNRAQADHLREALASNREIGVAMGVVMNHHRVTRDQAFDLLRIASQNTNRKLRDIATEVADTGAIPLPAPRALSRSHGDGRPHRQK